MTWVKKQYLDKSAIIELYSGNNDSVINRFHRSACNLYTTLFELSELSELTIYDCHVSTLRIEVVPNLQIITAILNDNKIFGPNSASILITASRECAAIARLSSIRTWNCVDDIELPEWVNP